MKIGKCSLKNFGSYPSLEFDFSDLGLSLVSGDTGSGKSTFMDATSWTLFGITSKEGAADDIRGWDADDMTEGTAYVFVGEESLTITRRRGPGKNDLFFVWTDGDGVPQRGKDMNDTQRLIDKALGCTAELFLLGSYLTQFSKADTFFIAKAKDRREVLEKIADQEFAISIGEKASEARKVAKKEKEALDLDLSKACGRVESLRERDQSLLNSINNWIGQQKLKIETLQGRLENFESEQKKVISAIKTKSMEWQAAQARKLNDLQRAQPLGEAAQDPKAFAQAIADTKQEIADLKDTRCSKCGSLEASTAKADLTEQLSALMLKSKDNDKLIERQRQLNAEIKANKAAADPHLSGLQQAQNQTNPYGEQVEAAKVEVNPFIQARVDAIAALQDANTTCNNLEAQVDTKEELVASLTWLYDKSFELRGLLMARAVDQIQAGTNGYLERNFDAALRVRFVLSDSDKLEIEISNNGFPCNFKQLSGGERTMLKLAFSLSLMRAAQDKAGVSFDMIMLDEPFSGLSGNLKVRAFGLLQQLESEYGSVLVIDHGDEMKAQFDRTFLVDKSGGHSAITESTPQ